MEFNKNKFRGLMKGIILVVALLVFFKPVSAVNVGVSPATINFEGVLRGGYAERTVVVSADSDDEVGIVASKWGEAQDWINFSEREFFVSRNNPYNLDVFVVPPGDIPNGNYTAFVRIMTSSLGEGVEGHAVGVVRSSLDLAVNIEIIDTEIIDCRVSKVGVDSAEKGDDILFTFKILNNGNVRLDPEILIDIWDQDQVSIVDNVDYSAEEILPTQENEFVVRVPSSKLDVAQYWADVSVLECYSSNLLTFDVLAEGALKANGVLLRVLSRDSANVGETVPVEASFKNTGEKEVDAQFKGTVTRNEKVVQILESPISNVLKDDIEKFTFFFTPQDEGRYVVSGRVYYSGKKTFEKSAVVEVFSEGGFPYLIIVLYLFVVGLIVYLIYKIRKERGSYSRKLRRLK